MNIVEKLRTNKDLPDEELLHLLNTDAYDDALAKAADEVRRSVYKDEVFLRGLIEFTNYCRNNCYYCGIRGGNQNAERYRLSKEELVRHHLLLCPLVLQGGEDLTYSDEDICNIVKSIKELYPEAAVTLSIGEREKESYRKFKEAGADRYLLRHETATEEHYRILHPEELSLSHRKQCLYDLKDLSVNDYIYSR